MKKLIGMLIVMSIAGSSYAQTYVVKERAKISDLGRPLSSCFPKALTYSQYSNGDFFIFDGQNTILASGEGDIRDATTLQITNVHDLVAYTVGKEGQAGVVFSDVGYWTCDSTGHLTTRYLESDTEDESGLFSSTYTWADAKQKCLDSTEGDYNDWYLPTIDQLGKMYTLRDRIGGFETDSDDYPWYWSSSEVGDVDDDAWYQSFDFGYQLVVYKFSFSLRVRCVRAIKTI